MTEKNQDPRVLQTPSIAPQTEIDPEAAYLTAIISLPRVLSDMGKVLTGIVEVLENIDTSLVTVSLYYERKGLAEKILRHDDFSSDGGNGHEETGK